MERILEGLQPEKAFYYFEELSKIPRGSGNEKQVSDYLYDVFKKKGFDTIQDKALNIIIKKPATRGYENSPTVMLQGHMDMVCEKSEGVDHNFEKDPIKLRIIGDTIYATGTTLGADNGIGVAIALAILEDDKLMHPPLEIVITSNEEEGMIGVANLDFSLLESKIMINLDNGGEGVFTSSCAGGGNFNYIIPINKVEQNKKHGFSLSIKGLVGGHSGAYIHKGRGNSIQIMGRLLYDIKDLIEISDITGGTKTNAIPREATAIISCDSKDELKEKIEKWENILKNRFVDTDNGINLVLEEVELTSKIFDTATKEKIIATINLIPSGVNNKNDEIDLVISSNNLAVIETSEEVITIKNSLRSSVEADIYEDLLPRMKIVSEILNLKYEESKFYPGWPYQKESYIRDLCMETYEKLNGRKGKVKGIHAGLECGFFISKMQGLDALAIGPVMSGVHTPKESLNIPSVGRLYGLVAEVLKKVK